MHIIIVAYASREDMLSHDRSKGLWERPIDVEYREDFNREERNVEETPGVKAVGFFNGRGESLLFEDIAKELPWG